MVESELEGPDHQPQAFLLELGKGFAFVARQRRITLDSDHFSIDLVFYNVYLKCYILVDLKVEKLTHADVGQMQLYVNYYDETQRRRATAHARADPVRREERAWWCGTRWARRTGGSSPAATSCTCPARRNWPRRSAASCGGYGAVEPG